MAALFCERLAETKAMESSFVLGGAVVSAGMGAFVVIGACVFVVSGVFGASVRYDMKASAIKRLVALASSTMPRIIKVMAALSARTAMAQMITRKINSRSV